MCIGLVLDGPYGCNARGHWAIKRGPSGVGCSSTSQVKETTALRPVSLGMSEWVGLMKDVRRCKV